MDSTEKQRKLNLATVRPSIQDFAIEMELRLRENGYVEPGWWLECDVAFLGVKLLNEANSLLELFDAEQCNTCVNTNRGNCSVCSFPLPEGSAEKAVDVANLCMMMWVKKGGL
jgi:hypothetical protein